MRKDELIATIIEYRTRLTVLTDLFAKTITVNKRIVPAIALDDHLKAHKYDAVESSYAWTLHQ